MTNRSVCILWRSICGETLVGVLEVPCGVQAVELCKWLGVDVRNKKEDGAEIGKETALLGRMHVIRSGRRKWHQPDLGS